MLLLLSLQMSVYNVKLYKSDSSNKALSLMHLISNTILFCNMTGFYCSFIIQGSVNNEIFTFRQKQRLYCTQLLLFDLIHLNTKFRRILITYNSDRNLISCWPPTASFLRRFYFYEHYEKQETSFRNTILVMWMCLWGEVRILALKAHRRVRVSIQKHGVNIHAFFFVKWPP